MNENEKKEIEEMVKVLLDYKFSVKSEDFSYKDMCKVILNAGYRNVKDKVVLSKEDYEKLKSLYDTQQGAIMTSSIGDLPLTVEGLRKAVDEIARLIYVQTELQELNMEYYNNAKDLKRELKQARKEEYESKKKHLQSVLELSNNQLEKVVKENEELKRAIENLSAHAKINDERLHIRIKDQARKETAREILKAIKNHRNGIEDRLNDSVWEVSGTDLLEENLCGVVDEYGFFNILDDIAKEYGVEVEDER